MVNPLRPKILKGALVHFDGEAPQGRTLVFRYNPASLHRAMSGADSGGAHAEHIKITLTLDATDDLEQGDLNSTAVTYGILPDLCAIELFLQASKDVAGSHFGSWFGSTARQQPFTIFMWGRDRIIPVKVTDAQVREEMFDIRLNPIRAEVDLTLEVVREGEYPASSAANQYLASFLKRKQQLAQLAYATGSLEDLANEMSGSD